MAGDSKKRRQEKFGRGRVSSDYSDILLLEMSLLQLRYRSSSRGTSQKSMNLPRYRNILRIYLLSFEKNEIIASLTFFGIAIFFFKLTTYSLMYAICKCIIETLHDEKVILF